MNRKEEEEGKNISPVEQQRNLKLWIFGISLSYYSISYSSQVSYGSEWLIAIYFIPLPEKKRVRKGLWLELPSKKL